MNVAGRLPPFLRLLWLLGLLLALTIALAPLLWAIRNSLMTLEDTYKPLFIPFLQFMPTLETWSFELLEQSELSTALGRSLVVAFCHLLVVIPIGTLAGFALGRFRYRRPDNFNITLWFLSQRFLPPAVVIIPYLLMMRAACGPIALPFGLWLPQPLQLVCVLEGDRNLLNTLSAITLAHVTFNLPFVILIMRSIFAELPREIEEAAKVDGASDLQIFRKIALPLAVPGLVAATLITFAFSWNEFLFALILSGPDSQTLPLLIGSGEGVRSLDFPSVSVRALVAILPPVVLAVLTQQWIVRGLTLGAVKG
ncbi:MAG TPA: carbohydrate ABC transporter permease [Geminicoccus sp.]|uniref:carbohydrate ABC transporter permease n=1 Tax=Geminicoccus sp. TaxID=2024832 RepID=UPI002CF66B6A|nr:carbohydrate ABC transporter permease [Geminicoccus sp.]HWL68440.1 carbohydrate ABC transporter permease [Geminicoccus sp.]